jgi:hypothetical protein
LEQQIKKSRYIVLGGTGVNSQSHSKEASAPCEYLGYCVNDPSIFGDGQFIIRLLQTFNSEVTTLGCFGVGEDLVSRIHSQTGLHNYLGPESVFYKLTFKLDVVQSFIETVSGLNLWHDVIFANSSSEKLSQFVELAPKPHEFLHTPQYLKYFDLLVLRDYDSGEIYFYCTQVLCFEQFKAMMESELEGMECDGTLSD